MTLHLTPLDNNFAFEVQGLDLWSGLDDGQVRSLDDAWANQGVLVFRRQSLSEEELVTFSSRFGTPDVIVRTDWASKGRPEVTQISNMRNADGHTIGGLGSGELHWHTDQAYMAEPATGAILYGVEVPEDGPHTYWANLHLAYEALPQETKARIAGRRAIFRYAERYKDYKDESVPSEEILAQTPDVTHPLVHTHPASGAKTLYMDPSTMVGIEGMDEAEGRVVARRTDRTRDPARVRLPPRLAAGRPDHVGQRLHAASPGRLPHRPEPPPQAHDNPAFA